MQQGIWKSDLEFLRKKKYTFGNFLYLLQVILDVFSPFLTGKVGKRTHLMTN